MGVEMMKRLFLLLIFSSIGVVCNPQILIANQVGFINAPVFNDVETIIEPEVEDQPTVDSQQSVSNMILASSQEVSVKPAVVVPRDNITIGGRYIPLYQMGSTDAVLDNAASKYGDFIYGHNSGNIFGVLYNSWVGQTFSVTVDGVTKNYAVSDIVIYEKNQANGLLQVNGRGNYMGNVANAIKKEINQETGQVDLTRYSLSLMTCYGTMLGGGDATHRLVIFAYEI